MMIMVVENTFVTTVGIKNNEINEKYIKILQIYHKIIVIIFDRWLQHIIESNDIFFPLCKTA